jgi:hypothetical protein
MSPADSDEAIPRVGIDSGEAIPGVLADVRGPAASAAGAEFGGSAAGGDGAAQAGAFGHGAPADGWSSWWTRATPPSPDEPRPEPPEPRPAEPNGSAPVPMPEPRPPAEEGQLRRRVPQANLAAGLRRDNGAQPHDEAPVVRDPMAARNALSRFQAAQRAARDAVDGDRAEDPR